MPLFLSIGIHMLMGLFMILQPSRWANTPSYALLLEILPSDSWGYFYLFVGACLIATLFVRQRIFLVFTFTVGIALLSSWLLAFVVRFATDDGTTIANIIAWTVYLVLLIEAALALDEDGR